MSAMSIVETRVSAASLRAGERRLVCLVLLIAMSVLLVVAFRHERSPVSIFDETGQIAATGVRVHRDAEFIIVTGTVRNTSGKLCALLEVQGTLVDAERTPLTQRSVLAEPCDLAEGGASTFMLVLDEWPEWRRVELRFRHLANSPDGSTPL